MKIRRIRSKYWKPNTDYLNEICRLLKGTVAEGDILAISEKAISVASGNIVDEKKVQPTFTSKLLAQLWMRIIWGHLLGYLCHLKTPTIQRLRNYPNIEGARHKQLALKKAGLLQALRFGSEGGIDASNLPYLYVSIPPPNPAEEARRIHEAVLQRTGKNVTVLIVDSDKTYSLRSIHLSPTKTQFPHLTSRGGFLTYLLGRMLKLKPRSTPKAAYPPTLTVEEALNLAERAHHTLGNGAGKTAWDMAERFNVDLSSVTWEMLCSIKHYPIALFRRGKPRNTETSRH
jgi:F420-0:gamma-glutamyl ligase-like protein